MHIEPGLVSDAKLALSYATAAGAGAYMLHAAIGAIKSNGAASFCARAALGTLAVFTFFQVFPHFPVGVSEVHFILGSTLFLVFGPAPAALGLALGLLAQGVFFAPLDLPQYFMNVTTLLVPLFALQAIANRLIAPGTRFADISYKDALALSLTYQSGIVGWVGFWVIWGQGFGAETLASLLAFGSAYMLVIVVEPIVDLAALALAKTRPNLKSSGLVSPRLLNTA